MQSLTVVANECESPICDEFSFCFEEQKLGLPAHVAFQEMSERVGILEMHLFTLASRVQQRTGGNMAALVEKLAEMVRQRFRMRQKIKALTAEGRLQATVLLGLPPVILGVMVIVKWDYVEALFRHPELIAITLGLQLLGFLWIRHIIRFDR
ncbi:MAG: type II secretion system F family protein, partial [Bdellovibrionales bacterium]